MGSSPIRRPVRVHSRPVATKVLTFVDVPAIFACG
jgi:hypothetical protein